MAPYQQKIPNATNTFNADYAAIEHVFFARGDAIRRDTLRHLYAAGGDICHLVALAMARGVNAASWLDDLGEYSMLWKIACEASSTTEARATAEHAFLAGKIFVISLPELFARKFWHEGFIVGSSAMLAEQVATEREARLIRSRYRALMTGAVKATLPTMKIARAA